MSHWQLVGVGPATWTKSSSPAVGSNLGRLIRRRAKIDANGSILLGIPIQDPPAFTISASSPIQLLSSSLG